MSLPIVLGVADHIWTITDITGLFDMPAWYYLRADPLPGGSWRLPFPSRLRHHLYGYLVSRARTSLACTADKGIRVVHVMTGDGAVAPLRHVRCSPQRTTATNSLSSSGFEK
jgi:hypothetical protein